MKTIDEIIKEQGYFLIAEIGVNYYDIAAKNNISIMEAAKLMCQEAKNAGVDAVKFQTYKAGKIASKYSPSYWDTTEEPTDSQYKLFQKYDQFGESEYRELADYCKSLDVIFMSTPFDFDAADYLDSMMDYYKISSSDLSNIPFIEHIARKGKPILLSVGASNEDEIVKAINTIKKYTTDITLLHCVLEYPTPYDHANLGKIKALCRKFPDCKVGYSDHTKPTEHVDVIKMAYLLGAKVIEKHFTLDKTLKGNDHYHAMDVSDVKKIKCELNYVNKLFGNDELRCLDTELLARKNARRSLVLQKAKKKGDIIRREDLTFKRPGVGIYPEYIDDVVGKHATSDLDEDCILQWENLE